jgi:outer membrane protein
MMKFLWPAMLAGLSFGAAAQTGDEGTGSDGQPPRWGLGLAAVVKDSPFAGEGTRVLPLPLISYQGERFSLRGLSAQWQVYGSDSFELYAKGKFRMDGFEVDDLGKAELARNGIDYRLLEDRDKGFDLGLGMKWSGPAGELEVELLADATDTSGGQEVSIEYGYPIELGMGTLTPNVGATWMSKDMANYYYGTLDEEVARGVVDYKPGAVTIPHIGVQYFRPVGEKWSFMASAQYSVVPEEIQDSPLIEPDTDGTAMLFVGFSRGF